MSTRPNKLNENVVNKHFIDIEAGERTALITPVEKKEEEEDINKKGIVGMFHFREIALGMAASAQVVLSSLSMLSASNALVIASSGIGAVLATLCASKERKMTNIIRLKQINEEMEVEIAKLSTAKEEFFEQVNELERSVTKLEEIEDALEEIEKNFNKSVDSLESQLRQTKKILSHMRKNVKAKVLQNIIEVVINSDLDRNRYLEDDDINRMFKKLTRIHGVTIEEDRLKNLIEERGRDFKAVMSTMRQLLNDDVPESEKIINLSVFT